MKFSIGRVGFERGERLIEAFRFIPCEDAAARVLYVRLGPVAVTAEWQYTESCYALFAEWPSGSGTTPVAGAALAGSYER